MPLHINEDLESLSADVFELVDSGLQVESLTQGAGLAQAPRSCSGATCGGSGPSNCWWIQ